MRSLVYAALAGFIPIVLAVVIALVVKQRRERALQLIGSDGTGGSVRSRVKPQRVPTDADDDDHADEDDDHSDDGADGAGA